MRKNYAASVLSALETISRRGEVHIGADLTEADHCEVMDDLLACGILVRKGEGEAYISPLPVVTLKLFLPLLFSGELRLRPVSIPGCPLHFCTAIWKSDAREADGVTKNAGAVIAGGQGDSAVDAAISCLGELAERLSLHVAPDKLENRVFSQLPNVTDLDASRFLGLSDRQKVGIFLEPHLRFELGSHMGENLNNLSKRRVTVENCRNGEIAQLSSYCALFGEAETARLRDCVSTSGAAVQSTLDLAFGNALLEAAERDIFARCWYNRVGITDIQPSQVAEYLSTELVYFFQCRKRQVFFARVECVFAIHVALSISVDEDGFGGALGVSAGWTMQQAIQGAVREMLQSEFSQAYAARAAAKTGEVSRAVRFGQHVRLREYLNFYCSRAQRDPAWNIRYSPCQLLHSFHASNIALWRFDATHPVLGIPCVKILSPDLCTVEPRFGRTRLYPAEARNDPDLLASLEEGYRERVFPY